MQLHTTANPGGEIRGQILVGNVGGAVLDGTAEVPPVLTTTGSATVGMTFVENGNSLWYTITVTGLSGAVTGAHFHGPAGTSGTAGVLYVIPGFAGATSVSGVWQGLTAQQVAYLTTEQVYVNIHTGANPGGEVRGQVMGLTTPPMLEYGYAMLTGSAEVPAVTTIATGSGVMRVDTVTGTLQYSVTSSGLSGPITAAHIHMGAPGVAGPVLVSLASGLGANGMTIFGNVTGLTAAQIGNITAGLTYFNVRPLRAFHVVVAIAWNCLHAWVRGNFIDEGIEVAG